MSNPTFPATSNAPETPPRHRQQPTHPILEGLKPFDFPHPYNEQVDHLIERVRAQAKLLFEYQANTSRTDDTFSMGLDALIDMTADLRKACDTELAHTSGVWNELQRRLGSDEWRFQSASSLVCMVRLGGFGEGQGARQKLIEAIDLLDLVIDGGGRYKPLAELLRQEALQHPLMMETAMEATHEP
ncbi:MAG: hypothetical protein ACOX4Z_04970 [Desulfobulbus sp.]